MKNIKRNKFNRNGGITKKPGRKAKKEPTLTPKQAKFIEVFNSTGNESLAKKKAGYSPKTKLVDIRNMTAITPIIRDIGQELKDNASMYLDKLESIMNDDNCSFKVQADIAMNLLDRAGYKAVERKEASVKVSGNALTIELAQRARELLKNKAIDVMHEVVE